jgi:hypothetical protein
MDDFYLDERALTPTHDAIKKHPSMQDSVVESIIHTEKKDNNSFLAHS